MEPGAATLSPVSTRTGSDQIHHLHNPASGFILEPGFKRFLDAAHTLQAKELALVFYLI